MQAMLTLRNKNPKGLVMVKTSPRPENLINLSYPKMRLIDNLNKSLNIIQIDIKKDKDLTQHPEEVNIYLDPGIRLLKTRL